MDRCAECGFEYDLDAAAGAGRNIVDGVSEFSAILVDHSADLRTTEQPSFEPMGRDERVTHDGYADQDPDDVARQMTDAALLFANVLSRLEPGDWERTVMSSYPKVFERSLRWVAVHTVHDVRHHLGDVLRQLSVT